MSRWARIFMALLLLPLRAHAEDRPSFDSLWQLANSKPGHQTIDEAHVIRVVVPDEHAIYFFSKPGQPEHPAVFRRTVVQQGSGVFIRTEGWCYGDAAAQAACDKVKAGFEAQDAQMRQQFQKKP